MCGNFCVRKILPMALTLCCDKHLIAPIEPYHTESTCNETFFPCENFFEKIFAGDTHWRNWQKSPLVKISVYIVHGSHG